MRNLWLASAVLACGGMPLQAPLDGGQDVAAVDSTLDEQANDTGSCTTVSCSGACVDTQSDAKNCGRCAHDCLGGACAAGVCQPFQLAISVSVATAQLVLAGATLYWSGGSINSGAVYSMSTAGGVVHTLTSGLGSSPTGLSTDGASVFFAVPNISGNKGLVLSVPTDVDGGALATTLYTGQDEAYATAVDATNVYWTNRGTLPSSGAVNQAPKGGGGPITPLASSLVEPQSLAVDGTSVYWASYASAGTVSAVPIGGGAIMPLLSVSDPGALVLHAGKLVFASATNIGTAFIEWMATDGGSVAVVSASTAVQLSVDDDYVYFTHMNPLPGTIDAVPLDGGAIHQLVGSISTSPYGLAQDATALYWTQIADSTIMKLAK